MKLIKIIKPQIIAAVTMALIFFIPTSTILAISDEEVPPPSSTGTITIINNTSGGNGTFNYTISGPSSSAPSITTASLTGTSGAITVNAGTYSIAEASQNGWNITSISCSDGSSGSEGIVSGITVSFGGNVTCTFSNSAIAPKLTLVSQIVNDNGGTATTSDFTLIASSTEDNAVGMSGQGFAASGGTFQAGTYKLSESTGAEGYSEGDWNCVNNTSVPVVGDTIKLDFGDVATCTIINNDKPATLTIVKHTGASGDGLFGFTVASSTNESIRGSRASIKTLNGEGTTSEDILLNPGTYDVSENASEDWHLSNTTCIYDNNSIGESLPLGGEQMKVDNGDHVICTFTNARYGTLIVKKIVVNDNSGTASAADFSFQVDGGRITSFRGEEETGATTSERRVTLDAGAHSVTEPDSDGYTASYDNCTNVSVPADGEAICTITNDDNAPVTTTITSTADVINIQKANGNGPAGGGGSSGSSGGQVLGASTRFSGSDSSASSTCGALITEIPMVMGFKNKPDQVRILQKFLNNEMGVNIPITGFYGPKTKATVRSFQLKYWQDVLLPWVKFGLPTDHTTTGRVSKTTGWKINSISCPSLNAPFPILP